MRWFVASALLGLFVIALSAQSLARAHGGRAQTPTPKLQVICAVEYGDPGRGAYRTRPHECMFHKRFTPVAYSNMVAMRDIRWTHWGPKVAIGKGKFLANMVGPTPGKVRLTHPVQVCGHRVFTLAHFKFQGLPSSGNGLALDRQVSGC